MIERRNMTNEGKHHRQKENSKSESSSEKEKK